MLRDDEGLLRSTDLVSLAGGHMKGPWCLYDIFWQPHTWVREPIKLKLAFGLPTCCLTREERLRALNPKP